MLEGAQESELTNEAGAESKSLGVDHTLGRYLNMIIEDTSALFIKNSQFLFFWEDVAHLAACVVGGARPSAH